MTESIETLGHALPKEIARVRELIEQYQSIGPSGQFGVVMMSHDVAEAENAILNGDVVAMLRVYQRLKTWND
jgi:hypothetical protein